ncbi:MAG: OmpH family outer membrane protein [Pseudomonadota bacterium]
MKVVIGLIVCSLMLFYSQGQVLGAGAIKVGVIDIQQFQEKSKAFQKTRLELKKKFDAFQQKLDEEKQGMTRLEEDFKKQSMMLSLDAKEDKKRELEKKRRYYKYLYEDLTDDMKEAEVEATKKIGKELEKVMKKIGEQEGYTIILEKRTLGLIYYNDAIEITDQVTQAYDRMKQ